ncbi:MAG: hypothetical protein J7521_20860 [Caulobacter sp.]|nr:hypothetical protein [Caulobacter sp.]
MSHARAHQQRVLAAQLAGSARLGVVSAPELTGSRAVAYAQIRTQLADHMRSLKALQSVERKIELKRQILPEYDAWIGGVFDAERDTGQGVQDEVFTTTMLWRIDVGDYRHALEMAAYAMRWKLALPEHIVRDLPTLVTEEISEAALQAFGAGEDFPRDVLTRVAALTNASDMHDQVRAKLHKAMGLEIARRVDEGEDGDDGVAGGRRARLEAGLAHLRRALVLNSKAGVKKDIERLERALKALLEETAKALAPSAGGQAPT